MQRLEVSDAVRHIYIYDIRRLRVKNSGYRCLEDVTWKISEMQWFYYVF
jgi:hypothetical protein